MQLLLILSALFSALTGATGARVPELRSHQAAVVQAAQRAAPARVVAMRPPLALPVLDVVARSPHVEAFVLAQVAPLYATRRRE